MKKPKEFTFVSLSDFVLERKFHEFTHTAVEIRSYAGFLSLEFKIENVVPCDEKGNPFDLSKVRPGDKEFEKAKEKVWFEGFQYDPKDEVVFYGVKSDNLESGWFFDAYDMKGYTIEDSGIIEAGIKATPAGINQIFF